MEIIFARAILEKDLNEKKKIQKKYPSNAKKIMLRMSQLQGASCLEDLRNAPGRFQPLKDNRSGQIACDLTQPFRLIFEVANEPIPTLGDGVSPDWKMVTRIRILEIEDYHK